MPLNKNEFIIKRNDTLPSFQVCIIDTGCLGGKQPMSLSGVTGVTFTMANQENEFKILAKEAQIVSYSGGTIQYNWDPEDTNESGRFNAEFQMYYSDGKKLSIPENGYFIIDITKDLNPY